MQIIQSVAPDLSAGLTDSNKLVVMVETADGEHMSEVTDIDKLVQALRHLELIQMERSTAPRPGTTSAEADLEQRRARGYSSAEGYKYS